jgi:hypothetical protein
MRPCSAIQVALLCLAALAPAWPASAAELVYEISLRPVPEGLERTFSGWEDFDQVSLSQPAGGKTTPNGRLPDEELADLAKLYRECLTEPHELRQKFRGVFAGRMPDDIGGRGDYLVYRTPLGDAYVYLERFRGVDDIDLALADRRAAVDTMVDVLRDVVDSQLTDHARRAEVRRFFHQELRQDLRKLSLVPLNESQAAARNGQSLNNRFDDEQVTEDFINRFLQYGLERDYFDASALSEIRLVMSGDTDDGLRFLRRIVARKTGLDEASIVGLFDLLEDESRLLPLVTEHVEKHPEYKLYAQRVSRESGGEEKADPSEYLEYLIQKGFLFDTDRQDVRLELSLDTPVEPYSTNGEPDPSRLTTTRWTRYVDDQGMPTLCYAYWAIPAESFQKKHFGKVAISGSTLSLAAGLFTRLSAAQQAELKKHLESIEPGDALRGRVTEFAFVGPADDAAKSTAKQFLDSLSEEL